MAKTKQQKQVLKTGIKNSLDEVTAAFVVEYGGINTEELTKLRVNLHKIGSKFTVSKNRIVKKAVLDEDTENAKEIVDFLVGQVGIIYVKDVAATAKEVLAFSKDNKSFVVKGGVVDAKKSSKEDIKALSKLPSKEILLGQMVGSLVSPHRGLLYALNGVSSNLVRAISAIKDTKS